MWAITCAPAAAHSDWLGGDISTAAVGTEALGAAAPTDAALDGAGAASATRAAESYYSCASTGFYAATGRAAASTSCYPPSVARNHIPAAACVREAVAHRARSRAATAQSTAPSPAVRLEPGQIAAADAIAYRGTAGDWTTTGTIRTAYPPCGAAVYGVHAIAAHVAAAFAATHAATSCSPISVAAERPAAHIADTLAAAHPAAVVCDAA